MSNSQDSNKYNREVSHNSSYTDANGDTHTNVSRTSETVRNDPNSYKDGYVNGRVAENNYQEAQRDDARASNGLLLGILLAVVAGLSGLLLWYFNSPKEANNTPTPIETPVTNVEPNPTPEASQPPQNTTIIERTKEVAVPVPVPQPESQNQPAQPSQQDINVNVEAQPTPSVDINPSPDSPQPQPDQGEQNNQSSELLPNQPTPQPTPSSTDSSTNNSTNTQPESDSAQPSTSNNSDSAQ